MKQASYIATIGKIRFKCASVEDSIERVRISFSQWYQSGAVNKSDQSDWNVWSNRRTRTGGRRHVANVTATYDDFGKPLFSFVKEPHYENNDKTQ